MAVRMRWGARGGGLAVVLLASMLAGCAADTGASSGTPEAGASATLPGDAALTCQQVGDEIARQNAIIRNASAANAQGAQTATLTEGGNPTADVTGQGGGMVPGAQPLTPEQREAAVDGPAAVNRANVLISLGREKRCFR